MQLCYDANVMSDNPACIPLAQLLPTELFKALGDPNRVAILCDLCECRGGPKTVSELAAELPVDLSVVSRHLGVLKQARVLDAERNGKTVQYSVRARDLVTILRALADAIDNCCPPADLDQPASKSSTTEASSGAATPTRDSQPRGADT